MTHSEGQGLRRNKRFPVNRSKQLKARGNCRTEVEPPFCGGQTSNISTWPSQLTVRTLPRDEVKGHLERAGVARYGSKCFFFFISLINTFHVQRRMWSLKNLDNGFGCTSHSCIKSDNKS